MRYEQHPARGVPKPFGVAILHKVSIFYRDHLRST